MMNSFKQLMSWRYMEVFLIISLITFAVVFFFKLLSESAYTPPPKEENTLRNMRDSTGHFYVSRFHAPNYHGGYWDATIMSHERAGYYTCVQGKTKIELEKNIAATTTSIEATYVPKLSAFCGLPLPLTN